jgi:glycosyltransferase involved in cell wall biosynthesis
MKILYVVNNAAFFCSHRLPLALAAREAGHDVALLTGQGGSPTLESPALETLRRHGLPHHVVAFRSGGVSPWIEGLGVLQMVALMRHWKPDVVHCVTPKCILYGGFSARLTRRGGLILAVSGMGSLFAGEDRPLQRLVRRIYLRLARFSYAHHNCRVIVQNHDDLELLVEEGLAERRDITLIPGSGVPLADYEGLGWQGRDDLVILPARLLRDKGVVEFVEAARQLRHAGCRWRFALVGIVDSDNPTSIAEAQVRAWVDEGAVEWWGHCENMAAVYGQAKIVCLPSYREGMPKALLEAAAAGCAVVTTDTVGCRESVQPGISGDLVPVRDPQALARALLELIDDPARQAAYGDAGRKLARQRFGLDSVVASTLATYEQLGAASAH